MMALRWQVPRQILGAELAKPFGCSDSAICRVAHAELRVAIYDDDGAYPVGAVLWLFVRADEPMDAA